MARASITSVLAVLLASLLLLGGGGGGIGGGGVGVGVADGKVVVGHLHTDINALTDIYLGNFIFDARGGSVALKSKTEVGGQRFLFFDETKGAWSQVLAMYTELSCEQLSKLSLLVTEDAEDGAITEGLAVHKGEYQADLQIAPTAHPKRWYTMLSNCKDHISIDFTFTYLNPGGFWYAQFSIDEQGLLQMFIFLCLLYTVLLIVFWRLIYRLYRSQSMHTLVWMLLVAVFLEYLYLVLESVHGFTYAEDGVGSPALLAVGEVADAASTICVMAVLIMLSKGWTVSSINPDLPKEWVMPMSCGLVGYFALYILERVAREADHKYCYDSNVGAFALLLRACFCGYFLWCLRRTWMEETQLHRRTFLQQFGIGACVWFLALPLAWVLSHLAVYYWRMRIVMLVAACVHALSLGALAWLVWPKDSATNEYVTLTANDMLAGAEQYDEI